MVFGIDPTVQYRLESTALTTAWYSLMAAQFVDNNLRRRNEENYQLFLEVWDLCLIIICA